MRSTDPCDATLSKTPYNIDDRLQRGRGGTPRDHVEATTIGARQPLRISDRMGSPLP